jgi:AraC family transcriptional regulator
MSVNNIIDTIHFIEENYYRTITIKEIEQVSFYSYRNIHRIFKNVCKESIAAFQKRLKLENAYKMLLYNLEPIHHIAYTVGFKTHESFAKAFKQHFGFTATEVRKRKEIIFNNNDSLINNVATATTIPYDKVYMPSTQIVYSRVIASYESPEIELHWSAFMNNEFPPQTDFYGIIADETLITEDNKCRYDACASQALYLKEYPVKSIFGRKYLKFIHAGAYNQLERTYRHIFSQWMFESEFAFSNLPIVEHYEKTSATPDENITNIYFCSLFQLLLF